MYSVEKKNNTDCFLRLTLFTVSFEWNHFDSTQIQRRSSAQGKQEAALGCLSLWLPGLESSHSCFCCGRMRVDALTQPTFWSKRRIVIVRVHQSPKSLVCKTAAFFLVFYFILGFFCCEMMTAQKLQWTWIEWTTKSLRTGELNSPDSGRARLLIRGHGRERLPRQLFLFTPRQQEIMEKKKSNYAFEVEEAYRV